MQQRSAADVAIMKEIVRQVPELRPAVYSLIDRDVNRALATIEQVTPEQVPRKDGPGCPKTPWWNSPRTGGGDTESAEQG
jgi:hypothetical protein